MTELDRKEKEFFSRVEEQFKDWIGTYDAAKVLNVSHMTIRRWAANNYIQSICIGNVIFLNPESLINPGLKPGKRRKVEAKWCSDYNPLAVSPGLNCTKEKR